MPAGLIAYMAYLWIAFGDPLLFGSLQAHWGRELDVPRHRRLARHRGRRQRRGLAAHARRGADRRDELPSGGFDTDVIANLLEFAGFAAAVAALVACWRKLPAAYTLYALAALLFPLLYSSEARPLYSLPRFVVVVFPLFIAAAVVLAPHRVWRWVVVGVFGVLLVASTVLFASFV